MKICLPFLFVLFTAFTQAQVKFVASIEPAVAAKNEYINVSFTVINSNAVSDIMPPSFKGFKVIAGPSQSSSSTVINGVVTTSIGINYVLQAQNAGTFTIEPAVAIVNGQKLSSNSLQCKVTNQTKSQPQGQQQPNAFDDFFEPRQREQQFQDYIVKEGESIQSKIEKNLQLKLQVNKKSCYVGEPITASYILNTRLQSQIEIEKNPRFSGFSVIDMLQGNTETNSGSLNGRPCNAYTLRKVQLYPLQAGSFEIDAATLKNMISFLKYEDAVNNNNNFFNETYSATSNTETIVVKPLPDAGRPSFFEGAVGDFDMKVNVEKDSFTTDDAVVLRVEILGSGNMQLLTAPKISWPQGFEVFEQKTTDNLSNLTVPLSGSRIFEIPFTVDKQGVYQMPVIEFAYFNPVLGKYQSIVSKSTPIKVGKGTGKKKLPTAAKAQPKNSTTNFWWILAPITLIGIALLFLIRKKNPNGKPKESEQLVEEEVPEVKESLPVVKPILSLRLSEEAFANLNLKDALQILNKEFITQLQAYADVEETVNASNVVEVFETKNVDKEMAIAAKDILQDIQMQLYAPILDSNIALAIFERANRTIQLLNQ
jgi:BatD DUF11 like domain